MGRPVTETTTMRQLVAFLYEDIDALEAIRLGLSVFGARATTEGGSDIGLGIVPIIQGKAEGQIPLSSFPETFIELSVEAEILKRLACFIRPGPQLEIKKR